MACVVPLETVRFGEPETAVWCDTCLLPSAIRQRLAAVTGMLVVGFADITFCYGCDFESVVLAKGEPGG